MSATFPTGLNSFSSGDTIESEEWNAIETKIGIDSSADTDSLDYLLKNAASSNPGHKHTLTNGATDITASAAELNKLDGLATTKIELGYVNGVTSAIQDQIDAKQAADDALTSIAGLTYVSPSFIKLTADDTYAVRTLSETKTDLDVDDLEEVQKYADSPMVVSGGDISEGTTGTFTVAAGVGLFRTTDSVTGALAKASWDEFANQPITDPYTANTTYTIVLSYNGGSPTLSLSETSPYTADKRNIAIGKVMKDGSDNIHFISGGFNFQDGVRKLHQRAVVLRNLELNGGSTIAYKATNNFTMAAGIAFGGINKFDLSVYDSSVTTNTPIRTNGATFIEDTPRNTIDYGHYDAQDGTLGTVGNNKYGCYWIYKHIDDDYVYTRYGVGSYSLAEAQVTKEPSKPDHLTDFGCLIGRIIVPYNGGSFTEIDMVTDRFFVGTSVGDHWQLGNLQGGTTEEYYHLTSAQHTAATRDATNAQNGLMPSGVKDGYDDAVTKKHTQNTDTDLDATFEATFVKKADTVNVLSDITSAGADIEDAVTKKHAANADTALGAQSENLDMNTHKITGVVDPTADQEAATKKYVDDNSINNLSEDATPQLGGDLDVVTHKIVSTDNRDIAIEPNGTGRVTGVYRYIEIRLLEATTDHTVATVGGEFRVPRAMTIKNVGAYVDTAGVTGTATIDINEAGTTILSTKITIDTAEKTSETAAAAPVISDSAIAADAILTFDIDVIQTTAAKGLVVWMEVIL